MVQIGAPAPFQSQAPLPANFHLTKPTQLPCLKLSIPLPQVHPSRSPTQLRSLEQLDLFSSKACRCLSLAESCALIASFSDFHHIDLIAHFDRERIPERVVRPSRAFIHSADLTFVCRCTPRALVRMATSRSLTTLPTCPARTSSKRWEPKLQRPFASPQSVEKLGPLTQPEIPEVTP